MKPSDDAGPEREIVRLLAAVLGPVLGHTLAPWPASLYLAVERLARARGVPPARLLDQLILAPNSDAIDALVSAATVPHTRFFRHPEHFEKLAIELPRIAAHRRARIWCAGCATGEEPYSVALLAERVGVEIDLLATDISPDALSIARAGWYPRATTAPGSSIVLPDSWQAPEALRRRVRFERASITDIGAVRGSGPFDIVLCRNVLIYFSSERARGLVASLTGCLHPDGALIVAPVEALIALPPGMRHAGPLGWLAAGQAASQPSSAPRAKSTPPGRQPTAPDPAALSLEPAAHALGIGALDEAELALRAILDAEPERAEAWFLLGETLDRRGERVQSQASFTRAASCSASTPQGETLANAARRRAR